MTQLEFETLIIGLKPRLLAKARAMLQGIDEAEDMVQETLLRLWTVRESLSNAEIARILGVEEVTVRAQLSKARQSLLEKLKTKIY